MGKGFESMTSKLAKWAFVLTVLVTMAFGCKTADIKKTRKLNDPSGNGLTGELKLSDIHEEFVTEIFRSARKQNKKSLIEFMSKNKDRLAVDFNEHRAEYNAILDEFDKKGIITRTDSDALKTQFDRLADLAKFSNLSVGRRAVQVLSGGQYDAFDSSVRKTADEIYKVVADDFRKQGLVKFLETVFQGVIPSDENGKKMFNMMFMYFDHILVPPPKNPQNKVVEFQDKIDYQLKVVQDAAGDILKDSQGNKLDIWQAMLSKDDAGVFKLKLDEVAGKGLVKLMEESGPVMTKVLQSYVEDMPPDMQAAVRKVQSELPPMSEAESIKRFQELNIDLGKSGYSWPDASDKSKIEKMAGSEKTVFSYSQEKGSPARYYSNLGTASLSDSKVLYLKNSNDEIEEVVVKFIKRTAVDRFNEERKFFNVPDRFSPSVKRALDLYIQAIPGELDLNDEIKNMDRIKNGGYFTKQGVLVEGGRTLNFDVVKQPQGITFNTNTGHFEGAGHAMIMNKAQGKPINKWVKIRQEEVQKAREELESKYGKIPEGAPGHQTSLEYVKARNELNGKQKEYSQLEYGDPKMETLEKEIKDKTEDLETLAKKLDQYFDPEVENLKKKMADFEDLESVVKGIYKQWMVSAFSTGSFHPDPHQGNIFIDFPAKGGPAKVTFIDVGGTVEVASHVRFGFINLLTSLHKGDYDKALRSLKEICSLRCRHIVDLKQLDPNGDISELVDSKDSPLKKIELLLKATNGGPMKFDSSFGDLAKAQGIMLQNVKSVHKKTINATNSHHLLNKELEGIDVVTKKVFEVDLKYDFASTYAVDALNVYAGKLFRLRNLSLPAIVTAAGLGAFFGDEADVFTLADSQSNTNNSCVIEDGPYAVCITYEGLKSDAYKKLEQDCRNSKEGLWLKNEHTCYQYGEDFYPCNLGIQTVSYAVNLPPGEQEFGYACRSLRDLTK